MLVVIVIRCQCVCSLLVFLETKKKESIDSVLYTITTVGSIPTNVDDGLLLSIIYSFIDAAHYICINIFAQYLFRLATMLTQVPHLTKIALNVFIHLTLVLPSVSHPPFKKKANIIISHYGPLGREKNSVD